MANPYGIIFPRLGDPENPMRYYTQADQPEDSKPTPPPPAVVEAPEEKRFRQWWDTIGFSLDPECGVPWYDKREEFAMMAFAAGVESTKGA